MRTVNLRVLGLDSKVCPNIIVDGKYIKGNKNKFESYEATFETEKDEVEIVIKRFLELNGKLWWLYALISFIISVFGLFEPRYDKKNIVIDCKFKLKLKDTNDVKIKFNTMSKEGNAVEIETENEYSIIENKYYVDKKAKTRWTILLLTKLVLWIIIIVLAVYFIFNKVGK